MKLLRTIRLDPSDTFIFPRAFRAGFLGIHSLGWSTLVQIVETTGQERDAAIEMLAARLLADFGAPDLVTARAAAGEEFAFAASLCDPPADTLIAMHRTLDEAGEIRETFRSLQPRGGQKPLRAFSFLEVEGDEETAEERVDLVTLAGREKP
jgi:hypothetical protein